VVEFYILFFAFFPYFVENHKLTLLVFTALALYSQINPITGLDSP